MRNTERLQGLLKVTWLMDKKHPDKVFDSCTFYTIFWTKQLERKYKIQPFSQMLAGEQCKHPEEWLKWNFEET